jgi:Mn-dependent DtxR family transcriptional regulator
MTTPDENKVLKIIKDAGGECTIGRIAKKMGISPNYTRVILRSMGENDVIDVVSHGQVRIAGKSSPRQEKRTERSNGMKSNGLERYLEDRAKWSSF